MLVLGRFTGESVNLISKTTKQRICQVKVLRIDPDRRHVELAFGADDDVLILRDELLAKGRANGTEER